MSYLKLENLTKDFSGFTLHVDSLEVKQGTFFGILGDSGAGKSTLLNVICGLEKQDAGRVVLNAEDISQKPANKREMAYVFQDALLFEGLSVRENLEYIQKAKGMKKSPKLISDTLCECEALNLQDRHANSLSGGEKQRVALAMALMLKPKILLLDEPFSNLDTTLKIKMRSFVKELIEKHDITAIMVTHDKDDAFSLFDEVMLLNKGEVIQVASPKQMYEKPNSLLAAQYFGIENIFFGSIQSGVFYGEKISLHVSSDDCKECFLIIPPFAISVCENAKEKHTVSSVVYMEGRWKIQLENALVLYSDKKLSSQVSVYIDKDKCILLQEQT